jgi:hypothetical protein
MERKMKKLVTLLLILAAFTSLSQAQMQIGPKVGLNISNVSGSDAGSPDSKTGFAGGLFFMYQFSNMFAIQPEAYYTMKGAKEKQDIEGYTVEATVSLDYIEVPLLLKLIIPIQGSSVHPAVFAGPAVGFNTTHKVKVEVEGQSAEDDIPDVKSTEFSLVFGGGVGFPVGNNELGFDVRYNLGLTTIDDSADEYDVKNNVISFNVYFGFSLQ